MSLPRIGVESFFGLAGATGVWPADIATDKDFLGQIMQRKELHERLNEIIERLPRPDMSLETAINLGHITEVQTVKLYESLSLLLESSQDYIRLVYYIPFEFLPNKTWHPGNKELRQASGRFRQAYMKSWKRLLLVRDARANFVDGDLLEIERRVGDLPRVVKAAHLIPKLVEKGLIGTVDAIMLMEESNDPILKNSIADTLPVLADLGLITGNEIKLMEESEDQLVNNMAHIVISGMRAKKQETETAPVTTALPVIRESLDKELLQINTEGLGNITKKREAWLRQKKSQDAIKRAGKSISLAINRNKLTNEELAEFFALTTDHANRQALVEGILMAVESIDRTDRQRMKTLYSQHEDTLMALLKSNEPEVKKAILKAFRHFRKLCIIDDGQLAKLGITNPDLSGPFSKNLELMAKEISEIEKMVLLAESDPELSRFIYPIVLAFGSRLKGYGAHDADIDLAVFVRPGVLFSERAKLHRLLKKTFAHDKIDGIIEFWLDAKEGNLYVHDFTEQDTYLGESHWTYIFFGAAWIGNEGAIRELYEKMLVPYMRADGRTVRGRDARSVYLEEIEGDILQYRLMHKGYEQFFPPCGGIHTPHSNKIDGESMFWDSGYRQLATRLFIDKVFLPKILSKK